MRIVTWNVNSVRARQERVTRWLAEHAPDVVCLQELKCLDDQFPREPFEALGYHVETYGQKSYNGVAILTRTPAGELHRGLPDDPEGLERRVIAARIGDLCVVNVYVVNGQAVGTAKFAFKLRWLERLRDWLADRFDLNTPLLVTGDFNVTFDDRDVYDPARWRERILCSTPERQALRGLTDLGLTDVFRKFHEEGGHYTWWDFRIRGFERNRGLRIDHFLATEALLPRCRAIEIDVAARGGDKPSDHAPVVLTLDDSP